jgi:hypothetical protein
MDIKVLAKELDITEDNIRFVISDVNKAYATIKTLTDKEVAMVREEYEIKQPVSMGLGTVDNSSDITHEQQTIYLTPTDIEQEQFKVTLKEDLVKKSDFLEARHIAVNKLIDQAEMKLADSLQDRRLKNEEKYDELVVEFAETFSDLLENIGTYQKRESTPKKKATDYIADILKKNKA